MSGRPQVDGGRCVHSRIETASCQACVRVCPTRAWRLDDDGLGLDEAACDGCGLCAAACPTGAIGGLAYEPARRRVAGQDVLLVACDRIWPEPGEGWLPCLHGIGLMALLEAWRLGRRIWLVASGDCAACTRGGGERLEQRIDHLNGLFQDHGLAPIKWRRLGFGSLAALLAERSDEGAYPSPDKARRNWLGLSKRGREKEGRQSPLAPGTYFTGEGPLPWVVALDAEACIACHACVRICPTGALNRQDLADPVHGCPDAFYRLNHHLCTGCDLCRDICEHGAIGPRRWILPTQETVLLRSARCTSCGICFQYPATHTSPPDRCRICATGKSLGRLYQTMA